MPTWLQIHVRDFPVAARADASYSLPDMIDTSLFTGLVEAIVLTTELKSQKSITRAGFNLVCRCSQGWLSRRFLRDF